MDPRLSLKALKVVGSMSEETICYSATVCLDGQPVLYASNHGHGGADMFLKHERATAAQHQEILRIAREQASLRQEPAWWNESESYTDFVAGTHVDTLLEWMVQDMVIAKREDQQLRRWCRSSIVLCAPDAGPGHYCRLKARFNPGDARQQRELAEHYPGYEVVNKRF